MTSRAELLAPVSRWTPRRKAAILRAIEVGLVTEAEVRAVHRLSREEIRGWFVRSERFGLQGLSETLIQAVGRVGPAVLRSPQ